MKTYYERVLLAMATTLTVLTAGIPSTPLAFAANGLVQLNSNRASASLDHSTKHQHQSPSDTQKPYLVALGDSITFGYNLQDTKGNTVRSHFAYPMLIAKDDHLRVGDLGIPGWTSGDLLHALSDETFVRSVQSANVISINIGSNDLLRLAGPLLTAVQRNPGTPVNLTNEQYNAFNQAVQTFDGNIQQILETVRKLTDAPILLYNLYNPFPSGTSLNRLTAIFEAQENQGIQKAAANFPRVTVVNAQSAFAGNQIQYVRVFHNDVHPTGVGQYKLAQLGEAAMLPYLGTIFNMDVSPSVSR